MTTQNGTTVPFLAGFVTGRGGFDEDNGRLWLFLLTLDREVATEAMNLWGGRITARSPHDKGEALWKWTATGENALAALSDMVPFMRGYKREKALGLLAKYEHTAA